MGMYNTAKLRKCLVKFQMCGRVGRRIVFSFHTIAFHIDHYHVIRCEQLIIHTAWLDHEQPGFTIDSADIAPCIGNKSAARKLHIGFIHLFFQFFQHNCFLLTFHCLPGEFSPSDNMHSASFIIHFFTVFVQLIFAFIRNSALIYTKKSWDFPVKLYNFTNLIVSCMVFG